MNAMILWIIITFVFFDDLTGNAGIPNPMQMNLKVTAHSMDFDLVKRYLELNPYKHLMVSDPQRYDNDRMIYESHEEKISFCTSRLMESNGILLQLFSRFVTEESVRKVTANTLYGKLDLAV